MDYIFDNIGSADIMYWFFGIVFALFLLAVIIYLFDRSGGYF